MTKNPQFFPYNLVVFVNNSTVYLCIYISSDSKTQSPVREYALPLSNRRTSNNYFKN